MTEESWRIMGKLSAIESLVWALAATSLDQAALLSSLKSNVEIMRSHFDYSTIPDGFVDEFEGNVGQYLSKFQL